MRHVPLSVCFVISNYYFYVDHWLFAFFFLTELVVCFVIPVVGICLLCCTILKPGLTIF